MKWCNRGCPWLGRSRWFLILSGGDGLGRLLVGFVVGRVEEYHGFLEEASAFGIVPVEVDFDVDRGDEPEVGIVVRDDPHDVRVSFDLAVQSFKWVAGPQLAPIREGEVGARQPVFAPFA